MANRRARLCGIGFSLLSLMAWECGQWQPPPQPDDSEETPLRKLQQSEPEGLEPDVRLDINAAGRSELESLPGVGPVLARRILEYRANNPPFRRVEEIMIVHGIGRRKFEALRGRIRVAESSGRAAPLSCSASVEGLK